jgi:hypothetical protein
MPEQKKSNENYDYIFYEQCRKRERVIRKKKKERKEKEMREKEATKITKSSSLFPKIAVTTITGHILLYI